MVEGVVDPQQGDDFEDVFNDNEGEASAFGSLAATLALATANEREQRRRRTLVENLIHHTFSLVLWDDTDTDTTTITTVTAGDDATATTTTTTTATTDAVAGNTTTDNADVAGAGADGTGGGEGEGEGEGDQKQQQQQQHQFRENLIREILEEDAGSSTVSVVSLAACSTATSRTIWNKNQNPSLHWVWETHEENEKDDALVTYSTCNVSFLCPEGIKIEFFSNSNSNSNTIKKGKEQEQELIITSSPPPVPVPEPVVIAICDISNFQWTIEGNTKSNNSSDDGGTIDEYDSSTNKTNTNTIQSFWKIDKANLSWVSSSLLSSGSSDVVIPTEEDLLEGTHISLMGIGLTTHRNTTATATTNVPSLTLQSGSVLDLQLTSFASGGIVGNEEKLRVGAALRAFVTYLDQMQVPNLHLASMIDAHQHQQHQQLVRDTTTTTNDNDLPSFESKENTTLGDVIKYYPRTHCDDNTSPNKDNNVTATNNKSSSTSRFLSMGDSFTTFGALAATGASIVSPLGAVVSLAALGAKDGVTAAARKGKEVRISRKQQQQHEKNRSDVIGEGGDCLTNRISLDFEAATSGRKEVAAGTTVPHQQEEEDRYRFGDVARGVIGSIREKRQQQCGTDNDSSRTVSTIGSSATSSTATATASTSTSNTNTNYLQENKGRFAGVAGASAGAAAGFCVAGPVGLLAGSMIGSMTGQVAVHKREQHQKQKQEQNSGSGGGGSGGSTSTSTSFRIGDNIRKTVARGKELSGRDSSSSFQLGDLSRGFMQSTTTQRRRRSGSGSGAMKRRGEGNCENNNTATTTTTTSRTNDTAAVGNTSGNNTSTRTYRFGDLSRGLLAKGKEVVAAADRQKGNRFGGFSRGLFAAPASSPTTGSGGDVNTIITSIETSGETNSNINITTTTTHELVSL